MKIYAREVGATAQVAGGVPAMCDGVTQGMDGMELSLFSATRLRFRPPFRFRMRCLTAPLFWAFATRSCRVW
jgi:hypothetical protein